MRIRNWLYTRNGLITVSVLIVAIAVYLAYTHELSVLNLMRPKQAKPTPAIERTYEETYLDRIKFPPPLPDEPIVRLYSGRVMSLNEDSRTISIMTASGMKTATYTNARILQREQRPAEAAGKEPTAMIFSDENIRGRDTFTASRIIIFEN